MALGGWGLSLVVHPPLLCFGGCYPGSLSGTCWLALVVLLSLWIPWSCGVPGLHARPPVSGQVCVLPQSAIVTLPSFLWVGLLLAFVQGHCLRLTLWASACVGPHSCPASSQVGSAPSTWVPILWSWLRGGGFHRVPSPLSSFGMWSPFGVNSVFCYD